MKMGEGPLPRKSLVFGRITVNGTILRSFAVAELLSTVYQLSGVRSSHHCAQGLSSLFLPSAQENDLSSSTPITLSMTTWDKWQIPSLPETSLVAQMVKRLSTMLEPWVWSLDREVPWRRKRQPTPVPLPRKSHGWRSLVSMGSQRVRHDWATSLTHSLTAYIQNLEKRYRWTHLQGRNRHRHREWTRTQRGKAGVRRTGRQPHKL